jgi:hypothetical protein
VARIRVAVPMRGRLLAAEILLRLLEFSAG